MVSARPFESLRDRSSYARGKFLFWDGGGLVPPGLDAGSVQAKMPTPADSGSGPGMTAGLLHLDCSGDVSSTRPFDWAQGPGFDGVQGTGCMVDCVFFVLDGESCRFRRGRHWRGGRKPVPAGVRSATRGMEPKGGTPQAPKKWPPCHFLARVFCENPQTSPRTSDAPSMALLVIQKEKWQGVLLRNVCITKKAPQKEKKEEKDLDLF